MVAFWLILMVMMLVLAAHFFEPVTGWFSPTIFGAKRTAEMEDDTAQGDGPCKPVYTHP